MKIAISAEKGAIESDIAEVFGRCPYFIIAEINGGKVKKTEIIKNENIDQPGGAGLAAAKLMAEKNVRIVIAKNIGPRAMDALKQFNIDTFEADGKINSAIENYLKNIK